MRGADLGPKFNNYSQMTFSHISIVINQYNWGFYHFYKHVFKYLGVSVSNNLDRWFHQHNNQRTRKKELNYNVTQK